MTVITNCDTLDGWGALNGTLMLDTADMVEGTGSVQVQSGEFETIRAQYRTSITSLMDFTQEPIFKCYIKVPDASKNFSIQFTTAGAEGKATWFVNQQLINEEWSEVVIDTRTTPDSLEGTMDWSRIIGIDFVYEDRRAMSIWNIDALIKESAPGEGGLEVHAFMDDTEVEASLEIVGVGTYTTPIIVYLPVGTYTLRCTYNDQTQEREVTLEEGVTIKEDFYFTTPTAPTHILTVDSEPIKGVLFTIEKVS